MNQRIFPMLAYDDASSAIDFLCSVFGFTEQSRFAMPDGSIGHAELELHENILMLATTWKAGGLSSPKDLPALASQLFCVVDDVDAHFARAQAAGAPIQSEPIDQESGFRMYRVRDIEGHRWLFASRLKPVG